MTSEPWYSSDFPSWLRCPRLPIARGCWRGTAKLWIGAGTPSGWIVPNGGAIGSATGETDKPLPSGHGLGGSATLRPERAFTFPMPYESFGLWEAAAEPRSRVISTCFGYH